MSEIHIRQATADDNMLLAEMGAQTFYDSFAADNTPENMAHYLATAFGPEQQEAELADPTSVFLVAELDAVPVGYARVKPGDVPPEVRGRRPIELVRLYARKDWIGRGVGAALMKRVWTRRAAGVIRRCSWESGNITPALSRSIAVGGFGRWGHMYSSWAAMRRQTISSRRCSSVVPTNALPL